MWVQFKNNYLQFIYYTLGVAKSDEPNNKPPKQEEAYVRLTIYYNDLK